jgi:hypothetical protein
MKRGPFTHRDWASARRVHYSRAVDSEEILAPFDRVTRVPCVCTDGLFHIHSIETILSSILNLGRARETLRAPSSGPVSPPCLFFTAISDASRFANEIMCEIDKMWPTR